MRSKEMGRRPALQGLAASAAPATPRIARAAEPDMAKLHTEKFLPKV